jgi:hypothetical protein
VLLALTIFMILCCGMIFILPTFPAQSAATGPSGGSVHPGAHENSRADVAANLDADPGPDDQAIANAPLGDSDTFPHTARHAHATTD